MTSLYLKFIDSEASERQIAVASERFTIGRHSENDLAIADGRLSRAHLVIERVGDGFAVEDLGSSNGTEVNGEALFERRELRDGDCLSLGGFEIEVEIAAKSEAPAPDLSAEPTADAGAASSVGATAGAAPATASSSPGGMPKYFFFIAPALAVFVLLIIGVVLLISGGRRPAGGDSNYVYPEDPTPRPGKTSGSPVVTSTNQVIDPPVSPGGNSNVPTPAINLSDTAKIEQNAAAFLRKAARNDPRAFLTGQQAAIVAAKAKSMSGPMADNLASARKSSSQIRALATSKNLKPDLLAAAAIAKLGSSRGDVLASAQSMADTLDKLAIQIGNELGDDCLLMLAAYDQGEAGDFMRLRNMLQSLATSSSAPVREIRSIWFLKKQGKITDGEYDLAIRFLAAGTIMQNPHDLGVNAEAVTF